jgi:hypothetical protein
MLGRLRMTIGECITEYTELSSRIFGAGMLEKTKAAAGKGAVYNAERLEEQIKSVIKRYTKKYSGGNENEDEIMFDPREDSCKV